MRLLRRWFTSIPFFAVLGLALGAVIAIPLIPQPKIVTISISDVLLDQTYVDDILKALTQAREDNNIKAVVLEIDSPGGYVVTTEQIYLEVLRLRQKKPVVASVKMMAASGGYYIAVAANYIYAQPTSEMGSVGARSGLPEPEKLNETSLTSGLFKATGGSKRKAIAELEMIRQEFVSAVMSQRGSRLKIPEEELSQAKLYLGIEGLRYGLIDAIGTRTDAIKKAAELAGIRNYGVSGLYISQPIPFFLFGSADWAKLKAQTGTMPVYYYLYIESE
ncbi:MAG: S49 family peptidase [Chloroflexi bacterium]|nr:S49 family peptidase [Chloroflexota bacterium]